MGDKFDVDFKLLPPKLQMQLRVLALDANTSRVNLAYRSGSFRTSLTYSYGGKVAASLGIRRFSATVGVDPANGDVDLGLVFRGFRFGVSASAARASAGIGIGYGASLLSFSAELSSAFGSATVGLRLQPGRCRGASRSPRRLVPRGRSCRPGESRRFRSPARESDGILRIGRPFRSS